VKIAVNARQSQIVEIIAAAVKLRKDVFDVENGQRGVLLM
jgi:CHASE3 domain sensor protein